MSNYNYSDGTAAASTRSRSSSAITQETEGKGASNGGVKVTV